MLKLRDKLVQGVPLHLDLQEFLVSRQLFLAVGEDVPKVPFEQGLQYFVFRRNGWAIGRSAGQSLDFVYHSRPPILDVLSLDVGED